MSTPIRIVFADDHEIFRDGFKLLLKNQDALELVGEAGDGRELLQITESLKPDVVITDIKMPLMDGVEACKRIKAAHPDIQVIALSMFNEDNLVVDMLEAGARGYLLKNTSKEELLLAVKQVYEGNMYYCMATSGKLVKMIGRSKFNPYREQQVRKFTTREKEVIQLMCQQYTTKEIAAALNLSVRTVESHRDHLLEKTGSRNAIGIVVYAIKNGLYEM